jgi:hypothetical protein
MSLMDEISRCNPELRRACEAAQLWIDDVDDTLNEEEVVSGLLGMGEIATSGARILLAGYADGYVVYFDGVHRGIASYVLKDFTSKEVTLSLKDAASMYAFHAARHFGIMGSSIAGLVWQ